MFESLKARLVQHLTRPIATGVNAGPTWRLSTWWPSDNRSAMQQTLLRLLSLAHTERLELVPLVNNLASEHRGGYRRRLQRLARRLADGTPLVDALEQTPDVLRDDQVFAIRFAAQTGTLNEVYQQLVERDDGWSRQINANLRQTVLYALTVLCFIGLVFSFSMTFIAPTIEMIYEEAGDRLELPKAFMKMLAISWHLSSFWYLWLLAGLGIAWLAWSPPARRFFRRSLAARCFRSVAATRSAEFLRLLSLAVAAGRPLPTALSTMARYHFDNHVRHQLMFARIEAEHRTDLWDIFSEAQLLSSEEAMALAGASSNQSRIWMMRRLADWKEEQVFRHRETLATAVRPMVILALATIVLLIGVAWVSVLADMTQTLAQ